MDYSNKLGAKPGLEMCRAKINPQWLPDQMLKHFANFTKKVKLYCSKNIAKPGPEICRAKINPRWLPVETFCKFHQKT